MGAASGSSCLHPPPSLQQAALIVFASGPAAVRALAAQGGCCECRRERAAGRRQRVGDQGARHRGAHPARVEKAVVE
jgi:hypothetical protein